MSSKKNITPESERVKKSGISSRRPSWIKVRAPSGETYEKLRGMMRQKALHTVCEEARCPNMGMLGSGHGDVPPHGGNLHTLLWFL